MLSNRFKKKTCSPFIYWRQEETDLKNNHFILLKKQQTRSFQDMYEREYTLMWQTGMDL